MDLTQDQAHALHCLLQWLEIKFEAGNRMPRSAGELRDAVEHSALLRRLLSGEAPLSEPPPLSFGQPWYELVDHGHAKCTVQRVPAGAIINGALWKIVEVRGQDEMVVRVRDGADSYLIWKLPSLSVAARTVDSWIIERIRSDAA